MPDMKNDEQQQRAAEQQKREDRDKHEREERRQRESEAHQRQVAEARRQHGGLRQGDGPSGATAQAIELQKPEYVPGTLPIYILKQDGEAGLAIAQAAASIKPAQPPVLAVANVDDPTQLPYKPPSVDPPGAFVPLPMKGAPTPAPVQPVPTP